MKKTLFVTMLAAALMGGQVYATGLSGITHQSSGAVPPEYYGQFSEQGDVTGGDVTVTADAGQIEVTSIACVTGGYTREGSAHENSITMSGGEVLSLAGGESRNGTATFNIVDFTGGSASGVCGGAASGGHASNNTVYMTGGYAQLVFGGLANDSGYDSKDNVVVMTGGEVGFLAAAAADGGEASGNEIHLVGLGASYTIGNTSYAGSMLTIRSVSVVDMTGEGNVHGNSVNVYGTGIDIEDTITGYQQLNFHLVDAQAGASVKPMLTLGGALDLTGVEITFYADAVVDWTSFEGKTITLAQADVAIEGLDNPQQVNIMNDGTLLTTATLALADDGKLMQLTVPGNVPEPTTGTLSLLALAGLCARRRRK